jgi:anti-sigma factor RsiW
VSQNQSNPQPSPEPSPEQSTVSRDDLAAYALGELTPDREGSVRASLAASKPLRDQLARIQSAAAILDEAKLFEPPASIVQRALRLVTAPVVQRSWFERAASSLADLVFDSLATPTLAGFRGTGDPATRHMTFDSGAGEIDLEIRAPGPGSAAFHVTGQIVATKSASKIDIGFLEISSGAMGQCSADERGRFQFEVQPGTWDLRFAVGDETLALPRLSIG